MINRHLIYFKLLMAKKINGLYLKKIILVDDSYQHHRIWLNKAYNYTVTGFKGNLSTYIRKTINSFTTRLRERNTKCDSLGDLMNEYFKFIDDRNIEDNKRTEKVDSLDLITTEHAMQIMMYSGTKKSFLNKYSYRKPSIFKTHKVGRNQFFNKIEVIEFFNKQINK